MRKSYDQNSRRLVSLLFAYAYYVLKICDENYFILKLEISRIITALLN